jgi:predicted ATPase
VWLVQLAFLSEEALVPKAVTEALEVDERPRESISDTLTDVLRNRQSLLVNINIWMRERANRYRKASPHRTV